MMIQSTSDKHKTVAAPISRLHSINTSQLNMPARGAAGLENQQQSLHHQDLPLRLNTIKAKRKEAIKRQQIRDKHTRPILETHLVTADHIGQLHTIRPLEPRSALKFSHETTKLLSLLLAVSMFISLVGGVLVFDDSRIGVERVAHSSRGKLKTNNIYNNRNRHSDRSLDRPHSSQRLHRSTSIQHKDENEQQHQLRYLIAKTASIPQLTDHNQHGPLHKQHHERYRSHASHTNNNIVNYHDQENRHNPKSVQQRTSIEPSVVSATKRNQNHDLFVEQARPRSTNLDPELSSLNRPNSHYYDLDSLDVDLDDDDLDDGSNDSDDNEKATDDDDDDDVVDDGDDDGIDLNVGASSDIDVARVGPYGYEDEDESDDEDDQVEASISESAMHSDNDSDNSLNQRGPHPERVVGKKYRGDKQAKILHSRPGPATTKTHGLSHGAMKFSNESNTTDEDYRLARSVSNPGRTLGRPDWTKDHEDESFPESDDMVMPTVSSKQEASSEPIGHLEGKSTQPLAPYQSPVVVSISDNSFVSASPITMISDTDALENSNPRGLGEASVRYSRIIASPKNELSLHAKKHWHESHIQMIQEDPDELRKGNINSAIIAILFGIGATGMLIMIVSVKMRSIRERVAYKGRRRSLVPDTDFLINTIPI